MFVLFVFFESVIVLFDTFFVTIIKKRTEHLT